MGIATAISTLYYRLLLVICSVIATEYQTGLFATSFRIIEFVIAACVVLITPFFPILAHAGKHDEERLRYALQRMLEAALLLACGLVLAIAIGGPTIVRLLAGEEYREAGPVLQIQSFALIGWLTAYVWYAGLVAVRRQRDLVLRSAVGLVVILAIGAALIPAFGAKGAAVGAVVGELAISATGLVLLLRVRPGLRLQLGFVPRVALAAGLGAACLLVPGSPSSPRRPSPSPSTRARRSSSARCPASCSTPSAAEAPYHVGMPDTLVFIPAWNEEDNLPAVLDELHAGLPAAEVLVVDDGSTDGTAAIATEHGAQVLSFGENKGLRAGIAAGYAYADEHDYDFVGRVDADGQHPVEELARLLEIVRSGEADVAVGSRFASGEGYAEYRYAPSKSRTFGTAVLRRAMRAALGRPFLDATSGMYAVNARAMPILGEPYASGAPEVESLLRLQEAGLKVVEVPVDMRDRASGESKLRGGKALQLVTTVVGTILLYGVWRRVRKK